ncbi:MAG: 2-phospho-L-lactate transferase [Chloroflexota bacterium]
MRIAALAGGVGGAKLAQGLAQLLPPGHLTIIVNTADDFEHLGLRICPDLDTVCYTLAGISSRKTGWGRANESWNAMSALGQLGGPAWFRLGDRDLATHLERTRRLQRGKPLSQIVKEFGDAWGIEQVILPMTDSLVATIIRTNEGDLEFQEYFVHRQCRPRVHGFEFRGLDAALPAPGVVEALTSADGIIICPSNPWVSIAPILALPAVRPLVAGRKAVAVSPIVGGRALRGPAAKMYSEMGMKPSALAVATQYQHTVGGFVMDHGDAQLEVSIRGLGMHTLVSNTVMHSLQDRRRLARDVLGFLQADWK